MNQIKCFSAILFIFLLNSCAFHPKKVVDISLFLRNTGLELGNSRKHVEEALYSKQYSFECDQDAVPLLKDTLMCHAFSGDSMSYNFYFYKDILVSRAFHLTFTDTTKILKLFEEFLVCSKPNEKTSETLAKSFDTPIICETDNGKFYLRVYPRTTYFEVTYIAEYR